ncbi:MAG: hypothetical protein JRF63_05310 [Deltaproteobacteria bacterium]|nr:hypothetical protein [Deltaproteobacteria bacterium]
MNTTRIALLIAIATTLGCGSSPAPDFAAATIGHDAVSGASAAADGGQKWNEKKPDAGPTDGGTTDKVPPKPVGYREPAAEPRTGAVPLTDRPDPSQP